MKHSVLAFLFLVIAQPVFADTTSYLCTMTKRDAHGWIAPQYAFRIDPDGGTAMVADKPEWIATRFKNRGSSGYRISWNLTKRASAGGNLRVRYQANLNPADSTIKVRMAFVSIDAANKPYGVGTCVVETG